MGLYQMMIQEHWMGSPQPSVWHGKLQWKPLIAKWSEEEQIFEEWLAADTGISLDPRNDLAETMEYLQKWYISYVLADKLILGEIDANDINFKLDNS
jgi:hypothetical protein